MKRIASELVTQPNRHILTMRVDATNYEDATQQIVTWAKSGKHCYICAANVHMIMEVYDSPTFARIINDAVLVTSDGMPLVWALRALGIKDASRVYGPTLTLHLCEAAARRGLKIGLYGGTPESLSQFAAFLHKRFPEIQIVSQISPPFRPLKPEEDAAYTQQIVESKAQILFVGIGCPKQEFWMAAHQDKISAVMIGVGAAFDFYSGRVRQAPEWMQKMGLEWLFRLMMEPRRLFIRYFKHNPRFVVLFIIQWLINFIEIQLFTSRMIR